MSDKSRWATLNVPVEAKVVSATITHHPIERYQEEDGSYVRRPERLAGVVKLKLRFGGKRITTTKVIRFGCDWRTPLGWAREHAATPSEITGAVEVVREVLRDKVRDHGVTLDEAFVFEFIETEGDQW